MSDATLDKLKAALAEHVADEFDGALLGAYVTAVQILDLGGDDDWIHLIPGGSEITQRGLVGMLGDIYTVASEDD